MGERSAPVRGGVILLSTDSVASAAGLSLSTSPPKRSLPPTGKAKNPEQYSQHSQYSQSSPVRGGRCAYFKRTMV